MQLHFAEAELAVKSLGEIEKGADGSRAIFAGYGAVYGNRDRQGDIIQPGAFKSAKPKGTRLLWAHDHGEPLGVWKRLKEDEKGLYGEAELNLDVPKGQQAYSLLKQGAIDSLSVGFRIPKGGLEYHEEDDGTMTRHITDAELFEISLVSVPANQLARVTQVKQFTPEATERDLEHLLRHDLGLSKQQAKALLCGGYKSLALCVGNSGRWDADPEQVTTENLRRDADGDVARKARAIRSLALELETIVSKGL